MTASTDGGGWGGEGGSPCRGPREILTDFCVFAVGMRGENGRENVENAQSKTRATFVRSENPIQTELVRLNNLYIVFIDVAFYRSRPTLCGF